MATAERINAAVTIACIAAISLLASAIYRRRRSHRTAAGRWQCSEEEKPQSRFKRVLADNSYSPFRHLKREGKEKEISSKVHPYEGEITLLLEKPPTIMSFSSSNQCSDMDTPYVWVDTEEKLHHLARLLSEEQVFAVDTEQHSLRSFLGFTALLQISTRKEDFLVDTISLHDAMGILRHVFADSSICKVFHGADNDVIWLQRDFHIYVVNMFDTAKACEVLSKPHKSLAYLLETYCGVSTDKTLQREDWRVRPLSPDMIHYARTDAHYLLHIADSLTSELRKEALDISTCPDDEFNFFLEATRRSNMVCLQLYLKETESSPGASAAASIYSRYFNTQGITSSNSCSTKDLIWRLCAWRDMMARIHDESLRYVLSDQAIAALAAKVPKDSMEVYADIVQSDSSNGSSGPSISLSSPSPIVSAHLNELCCLLQEVNPILDDIFGRYLQKHLEPTGCCPLSIYNYGLLCEFLKETKTLFFKQKRGKFTAPIGKKASRELFVQKFSCKSPVYHNCRIYASDGRLLCYCDRRKLEWYIRRDLAKLVEKDPPAIMLLFEPKGRPEDEDNDFYIQSKKNICVGCGEKNHYLRYRIIPSCYRMHFPEHLKSHRSHDIVLLCVDCHEIAHSAAEKYKKQIASELNIPLFVQKIVDSGNETMTMTSKPVTGNEENGVSPLRLRTASMALLRHGSSMPPNRRDELMQIVRAYFGGRDFSPEDLEMALLVGMSPHEKRRLEKKRGLLFKHSEGSATVKVGKDPDAETTTTDVEVNKGSSISENGFSVADEESSTLCGNEQSFSETEDLDGDNDCTLIDDHGNMDSSDDIGGSSTACIPHQVSASKSNKKLSLLGHGPHGKQVVEHLLQRFGEDGISQFCQRWRQVFVEAVHPRFLPSGWDVMHSGRREFGDYSVYKPVNKVVETASSQVGSMVK